MKIHLPKRSAFLLAGALSPCALPSFAQVTYPDLNEHFYGASLNSNQWDATGDAQSSTIVSGSNLRLSTDAGALAFVGVTTDRTDFNFFEESGLEVKMKFTPALNPTPDLEGTTAHAFHFGVSAYGSVLDSGFVSATGEDVVKFSLRYVDLDGSVAVQFVDPGNGAVATLDDDRFPHIVTLQLNAFGYTITFTEDILSHNGNFSQASTRSLSAPLPPGVEESAFGGVFRFNAGIVVEDFEDLGESPSNSDPQVALDYIYLQGQDSLGVAAYTPVVGARSFPVGTSGDLLVGLPFATAPVYTGPIASATPLVGDACEIALVDSTEAALADAWEDFYYVRFLDGAAEGKYFTVSASDAERLEIDTLGDDLSAVGAGDTVAVHPYATLASVFPPDSQTALAVSASDLLVDRGAEVLLPNRTGVGVNRPPAHTYFVTAAEWRDATTFANADDTILYPDSYLILRQDASAGAHVAVFSGIVSPAPHTFNLLQTTVDHDNHLSLQRPVAIELQDLGLGSEFIDSTGDTPGARGDELLLWEQPVGANPTPDKIFYRVAGQWRDDATAQSADDYTVAPGAAMIVRKRAQTMTQTLFWTNGPND